MITDKSNVEALLHFFAQAGRDQENSEAWVHALVDIQESYLRIFENLIPEALNQSVSSREKREVLWDIREEFRHIEYHLKDIEGR
jgi:hypothetical protein